MSGERIVGLPENRNMIQFVGVVNVTREEFEVMYAAINEVFEPGNVTDERNLCIKRCLPEAAAAFMKHGGKVLRQVDDGLRAQLLARSRELEAEYGKGEGFFQALEEMFGLKAVSPQAAFKAEQRRRQLLAQLRRAGHELSDDESLAVLERLQKDGVVPMLKLRTKEERDQFVAMEGETEGQRQVREAREAAEKEDQESIEKARIRAKIKMLGGDLPGNRASLDTLRAALVEAEQKKAGLGETKEPEAAAS